MLRRKITGPGGSGKNQHKSSGPNAKQNQGIQQKKLLKIRFGRPSRILPLLFIFLIILNIIIILVRRGAPTLARARDKILLL